MSMSQSVEVPHLVEPVEVVPIDTASLAQKYLVRTAGNRQFEISQTLFDLITAIDGRRSIEQIARELSVRAGREFLREEVARIVAEYLVPNRIVAGDGFPSEGKKPASYLYVKLPLLSQKFLRPVTNRLHVLFYPAVLSSGLIVTGLFLLYFYLLAARPRFDFASLDIGHLAGIYFAFFIATFVHELGHSSACYHFGANPGPIGIGLYLYFPVFYTDVTDVWKLKRNERAAVDIGGIYFQSLFLPILYIIYCSSGNLIYIYAIYLLTFSSLTSLNPLFRFDGYWLVSDLVGLPNLRKRSGLILKQFVRRFAKDAVESLPPLLQLTGRTRYLLFAYAIVSNIFFLFFFGELVLNLPIIFRDYPDALSGFARSILNGVRGLGFSDVVRRLSDIFLPTTVLVMFLILAYRASRFAIIRVLGMRGAPTLSAKSGSKYS
jgi:putative peptide zinc metalloprotease protein